MAETAVGEKDGSVSAFVGARIRGTQHGAELVSVPTAVRARENAELESGRSNPETLFPAAACGHRLQRELPLMCQVEDIGYAGHGLETDELTALGRVHHTDWIIRSVLDCNLLILARHRPDRTAAGAAHEPSEYVIQERTLEGQRIRERSGLHFASGDENIAQHDVLACG